jgi:hypothetical protein
LVTSDSEVASAIAENAYRLLRGWRVPPGMEFDGEFDGAALSAWIDAIRREAAASGHLEIAMTMAGQVLTHVPPDPDGLWIYRAAAAVLNARDADDLRDGLRTQTLNARGVHWGWVQRANLACMYQERRMRSRRRDTRALRQRCERSPRTTRVKPSACAPSTVPRHEMKSVATAGQQNWYQSRMKSLFFSASILRR